MSDTQDWIITCRFPSWKEGNHTFPAFGVEYFITTGIHPLPEWADDDPRWLDYDDMAYVKDEFYKQFMKVIGKDFDGEILWIRYSELVIL